MQFWSVVGPPPRPRGFPTLTELRDEATRRAANEAYLNLLRRRAESAIAATDAALQLRHIDPAACLGCGYVKSDHYRPCARCGHSLYDAAATEERARVDARQYGLTQPCRDASGGLVEFSHCGGAILGVR